MSTTTYFPAEITIKVLTAPVDRLSLSVRLENGPERELKTVSLNPLRHSI